MCRTPYVLFLPRRELPFSVCVVCLCLCDSGGHTVATTVCRLCAVHIRAAGLFDLALLVLVPLLDITSC
jgi:hypothetical protein